MNKQASRPRAVNIAGDPKVENHVIPNEVRDLRWYSACPFTGALALAAYRPPLWDPSLTLGMTCRLGEKVSSLRFSIPLWTRSG